MANNEDPLMIMNVIDIPTFRVGLFDFGPRILAPVEFRPPADFTPLDEALNQANSLPSTFFPWCVTGGIGIYSLRKGPVGLMTRYDVRFRNAGREEMVCDFENLGEQVMGPEVGAGEDEKHKHDPIFRCWEKDFFYTGPPRVAVARFATRVFPGGEGLPSVERLAEFIRDVDGIGLQPGYIAGGEVAPQGYRYFYALDGKMYHTGFDKLDGYKPEDMKKPWASVEFNRADKTLYFCPQGNREKGKDFSNLLEDVPEGFLD